MVIFIPDCVYLFYYESHKTNPVHRRSYIDSYDSDWIKSKKATKYPINKKKLFKMLQKSH